MEATADRRESDVRLRHIEERQAKQDAAIHEIATSVSEGFRKIHEEFSDLAIDLNNKVTTASKRETNWGWFIGAVSLCLSLGYVVITPINERLDRYHTDTLYLRENSKDHWVELGRLDERLKAESRQVAVLNEIHLDFYKDLTNKYAQRPDSNGTK